MKLELWCIGKTNAAYLTEGISIFEKRIRNYVPFEIKIIPDVKSTVKTEKQKILQLESQQILKILNTDDYLVILDEKGDTLSSVQLSEKINWMLQVQSKRIVFLVGGAFGIHQDIKQRSNYSLSLSKMTFSHQMVRLFFTEQLYRAFSILKNEPYHNE